MSEVRATTERVLDAPVEQVHWSLVDYAGTHREILPQQFTEYRVLEGGRGAGTVVHWKLHATKKRVRDCRIEVGEDDRGLVEKDANSSMVTTWMLRSGDNGRCHVTVETTWRGADGIKGFFEKIFAPMGMRKIYDRALDNLTEELRPKQP